MENLSETKVCQNCKKDFVIEPDDFAFYEKMKVPAPTFCPDCRMTQRKQKKTKGYRSDEVRDIQD